MTPTPSSPPLGSAGAAAPVPPVPAAPPPRRWASALLRPLAAVFGPIRRRPARSLAILLLLTLTAFGLSLAGVQLWAAYHFRAARAAVDRYHTAEAETHIRACLGVWPNDPAVLLLAARVTRRAGLFDESEGFLDRYRELRGRDEEQTLERTLLTAERGDVDDVLKFCQAKVDANDPASPLILEALARGCLRSYRLADAEWAVETWVGRDANNAMAQFLRGRVAEERFAQTDAAGAYRRALEIDPDLDAARDRLAALLLAMNQAPEALPHLEYLNRRRPDDPGAAVRLAQCRDLLGQQDEATRLLDGVLARHPDHPTALAERGRLALGAGQYAEAEAWLRRAVARAPGDAFVLKQLHKCLVQSGQADQARALEPRVKRAEEDLDRLQLLVWEDIQAHPRDADLQYEAGTILLRVGSAAEGLRWLENAVRLNPRHAKAHEALADFYQQTGETAKAAKHRQLARPAAPDAPK